MVIGIVSFVKVSLNLMTAMPAHKQIIIYQNVPIMVFTNRVFDKISFGRLHVKYF